MGLEKAFLGLDPMPSDTKAGTVFIPSDGGKGIPTSQSCDSADVDTLVAGAVQARLSRATSGRVYCDTSEVMKNDILARYIDFYQSPVWSERPGCEEPRQ